MMVLAIVAGLAGVATLCEVVVWAINEWKQLRQEEENIDRLLKKHNIELDDNDKYYMSFEEFSEKMRSKEALELGK